jgi:hypothetical protein
MSEKIRKWKFQLHVIALLLMLLPAAGSYLAAMSGVEAWVWGLIGIVVLGNLLAIAVP